MGDAFSSERLPLPDPGKSAPEPEPPMPEVDTGCLARSAALRFPDLRELQGRERVEALIEHISDTAILRSEVEELRLSAHVQLLELRSQLRRIPAPGARTKQMAEDTRRAANPGLADQVDRAQWVVDRCTEQISRLGGSDYDAASRAYTLLSGS